MRIQLNTLGITPAPKHPSAAYVLYFCKHCGTELFGEWNYTWDGFTSTPQWQPMYNEFHTLIDLKTCPYCGDTLTHDLGYYLMYDASSLLAQDGFSSPKNLKPYEHYGLHILGFNVDKCFDAMQKARLSQQTENAIKDVAAKVALYESTAPTQIDAKNIGIKNDPDLLKDYLLHLIKVETNIYALTNRLQKLYTQKTDTDRKAYGSSLAPLVEAKTKANTRQRYLNQCKKALKEVESKDPEPIDLPKTKQPTKPTEPQYAQPGFFNKKRVLAENAELKAKYDQALDRYETRMDRYYQELENWKQQFEAIRKQHEDQHQQDIEKAQQKVTAAEEKLAEAKNAVAEATKNSSNIASPEKAHKAILDDEIRQAEEMLQKAIHCKHQLYNYNIVFAKYRNLVAVSTIYEYLMAGRCTELEGTNGAYNLYESELRANIIISQLSSVLESLEKIKDNQFMIYDAIQQTNASLYRLESTMSAAAKSLSSIDAKAHTMTNYMAKIASNSDVIAHNTAVTAHYSKINAELTNALGYMVALK